MTLKQKNPIAFESKQGLIQAPQSSGMMHTADHGLLKNCQNRLCQNEFSANTAGSTREKTFRLSDFPSATISENPQAQSSSARSLKFYDFMILDQK